MHNLQEWVRLHRMGTRCRESARLMRMSPNTERQYREAFSKAGLWDGDPGSLPELEELQTAVSEFSPSKRAAQSVSDAEPYADKIKSLLKKGASPRAIYDRLRIEEESLACSYSSIARFCRRLLRSAGVTADKVVIPVLSGPAEVAQVDFGYVGKLLDPATAVERKAWVFVMSLPYSNHAFMDIVFDQSIETFLALHDRAFTYFGGVPKVVVPDNLKSAVIQAAFHGGQKVELNRTYMEAARHFGFKIDPAPAYSPEKKGVVESDVGYVKNNFFKAHRGDLKDMEDAREKLRLWLREVFEKRICRRTETTPLALFSEEEKPKLLPLPESAFEVVRWKNVTVQRDSHVTYERKLYSVPFRLIGQKVWVKAQGERITIFADDVRVAGHSKSAAYRNTHKEHLPAQREELRHRGEDYWKECAAKIGPVTSEYISRMFALEEPLYQLRNVHRVLTALEGVPKERAEAACKRALHFENFNPSAVRTIVERGLEMQPWESLVSEVTPPADFHFSRSPSEILEAHLSEAHHAIH